MDALTQSLPTTEYVMGALRRIDRKHFVRDMNNAYTDRPSPLMDDQTISAPHMHAKALEYLYPIFQRRDMKKRVSVLDIGSGSGYLTACLGKLAKVGDPDETRRGRVVGVDIYPSLVQFSKERIRAHYPELFTYPRHFKILAKDGKGGHPSKSLDEIYDGIHIGAACDYIPRHILRQLKPNGILVLPLKLGEHLQMCVVTKDTDRNLRFSLKESVRYVRLQ
jgi:protein-L-isoaspartate(D-aspartate) O-methyltransferase